MTQRIAIVGAGIAGLTTAYRIVRLDPSADVTVYEAGDRVGGKVRTTDIAGIPVDEGIDGFLARVPAAVGLCRELGLGDRLTSPAAREAFVWRHGRLHRFPEGLVLGVPTDLDALRRSGIVSEAAVVRAAGDLDAPADGPAKGGIGGGDESVGSLVRRRLGDEIFEVLVGPLLSGVNAGDADELSLAAGAPQLAAAVADQPSLIAGLRRQKELSTADPAAPVFHGLVGGTQVLTDALAAALPAGCVRTRTPVTRLVPAPDGYRLHLGGGAGGEAGAGIVVLAVPSFAAGPLVTPFAPELGAGLATLAWSSVALVTFAVRRGAVAHPLDGSGFLVPAGEGLLMTACSFGSSKWEHWAPSADLPAPTAVRAGRRGGGQPGDDLVILRVSAGRHHDPRASGLDDDALVARLLDELKLTIGLDGPPAATRVSRWDRALPQYRPGHLDRARGWKDEAARHGDLFLTGASYRGLGLPACIADAEDTARAVIARS